MKEHITQKRLSKESVARFIGCLFVAVLLWLYVMYTEAPEYNQVYRDIPVEVRGYTPSYRYDLEYEKKISATFRGTNVELAQCGSDHIKAIVYLTDEFTDENPHFFAIQYEFSCDCHLSAVQSDARLAVTRKEAKMKTETFRNIPVSVIGMEGSLIANYDVIFNDLENNMIPQILVTGRASDVDALKNGYINATIHLTTDNINDINDSVENNGICVRTMVVTFGLPEGMVVESESGTSITTVVTFKAPTRIEESDTDERLNADEASDSDTEEVGA